ncbi:MAG: hypothetical protein ACLUW6_10515 [Coriobacteriaceae bacterium]
MLAAMFDEPVPEDNAERADLLLRHHIALWDVLESCDIRGASDASIANARPNDLSRVLEKASVRRVFCTGAAAGRYYAKLCAVASGLSASVLPSPSPANAALVAAAAWKLSPVADAVTPFAARARGAPGWRSSSHRRWARRSMRSCAAPAASWPSRRGLKGGRAEEIVILCGNGNNGGDGGWPGSTWTAGAFPSGRYGEGPEELTAERFARRPCRRRHPWAQRSQVVLAPSNAEVIGLTGALLAIDALWAPGSPTIR